MSETVEMLLAELIKEVRILSEKIDKLQLQVHGPAVVQGWASPSDAAIALKPDGVQSAGHLKALRLRGAFSDKDIRKKGRRWEYNIDKCRTALAIYFRRQSKIR
ncbi:MAG: hypothetical protein Kow00121_60630 [Elainellaceae cyanobacterium]